MQASPADPRIPITIITGFLGSGKTTFLRRSLDGGQLAGSLLVVNEAAAFGIDNKLLNADAVALVANGCLCCRGDASVKEELHRVLGNHLHRTGLNRIIIELSGLADPLAVIATIASDPFLHGQLRIAMVVTLVDCLHAAQSASTDPEHRRQIEAADIVLVTKTDLASDVELAATHALVAEIQPVVPCLDGDGLQLYDVLQYADLLRADRIVRNYFKPNASVRGRSTSNLAAPTFLACRPSEVTTFCLRITGRLDWTRLSLWLALLLRRYGAQILRIKGFLELDGANAPLLINCVRHIAYFPEHLSASEAKDEPSVLVFIVRELSPSSIARSLRASVIGSGPGEVDIYSGDF